MRAQGDTIEVPGATIHYEVRGSGPLLLLLAGGDGDADGMQGLVEHLSGDYTVLTHDRRGLSRSTIDDPSETIRLETHTDDVHHLLAALASEPVLAFGGSLGAVIGLDLVTRHPEQVRLLVAHEPPLSELLPDAERAELERTQQEIDDTFRSEGVSAAARKFVVMAGVDLSDREPDAKMPEPGPQRAANLAFFMANDAPAVRRYRLNLDALRAEAARIVPAAGRASRGRWNHRAVDALAECLGVEVAEFPGGHSGFITHPRAFAATLHGILEGIAP